MYRAVAFLLLALAIGDSLACYYRGSSSEKPVVTEAPEVFLNDIGCGVCGDPIDVTIVFRNIHQEPKFEFEVTVLNKPQRPLQYFLEEAAKKDTRARFTSSYWGDMGYMIDSINKVKSNYAQDKTYWRIVEHINENALQLGVSSYIPDHLELIQFNFTTYSNHGR